MPKARTVVVPNGTRAGTFVTAELRTAAVEFLKANGSESTD